MSSQVQDQTSQPITNCQLCDGSDLASIFFVGYIPPVNQMPEVGKVAEEQRAYPLELKRCSNCQLVQIGLEVNQNVLFPPEYPYLSGTTRILRENFADLYKEVNEFKKLSDKDLVMDIGSNDGTLLSNFHKGGHPVIGIEPSKASEVAKSNNVRTWMRFFNEETAEKVISELGQATVVTAANVFAHMPDVHGICRGITKVLKDEGMFVSESHYVLSLAETLQYDTVYHEHLRYYSLHNLQFLFEKHDLEIFNVKQIPTHGGSIRVYSARRGRYPIQDSVKELLAKEKSLGLDDGSIWNDYGDRIASTKLKLYALLNEIKSTGAKIYGIGAPSRSSTLINYVGLDDKIVEAVMEVKSSHKLNKYVPGTRIPVYEETMLYNNQPEYALLLSWHISDDLISNLKKNGYKGKFIVPLPDPRIEE